MHRFRRLFFLSILLSACQGTTPAVEPQCETSYGKQDANLAEKESPIVFAKHVQHKDQHKVIRTAEVKFQVSKVEKSTEYISNAVATFQGYIAQMEQSNDNYSIKNEFILRVPSNQFEPLLDALHQEAIFVNYKRIKSKDISSDFIDLEARLAAKKAVRARYIELLETNTDGVKEVVEAEEKIREIQEEIEAKEAQLRYLKTQVSLSTIHLQIYQKVEYRSEPIVFKESFIGKLFKRFNSGWQALLNMVLFLVNLWPLLILGALLFWRRNQIYHHFKAK